MPESNLCSNGPYETPNRMTKIPAKRLFLTRMLGSLAGLIQGDTLVRERWLWLERRLPETANDEHLLDVGCGMGAFTICAALRGYNAIGLTWNDEDAEVARARAKIIGAARASFSICDVRSLGDRQDLKDKFDFVVCCENIEHILDDKRLVRHMYQCLRPGGRLLLTTPNYHNRPITAVDRGPWSKTEDGSHVRKGYSKGAIVDLLNGTGFLLEDISFSSGFLSQKTTWLLRKSGRLYPLGERRFATLTDCLLATSTLNAHTRFCDAPHGPTMQEPA
jgi:SAM-dependent methyltransferase